MPISVFPERMDKLDPEDVNASLRTLETYVHYICERTEFALTNTFRTTTGLGSSAEAISLVLQEAVDNLSAVSSQLADAQTDITRLQGDIGGLADTLSSFEPLLMGQSDGPAEQVVFTAPGEGLPLKVCIAAITPAQEGEGDPSPSNVRPISGWTGAQIHVSPTTAGGDGKTFAVDWSGDAGTVYSGTLDVLTGTLTVTHQTVTLPTANTITKSGAAAIPSGRHVYYARLPGSAWCGGDGNQYGLSVLSSIFPVGTRSYTSILTSTDFAMGLGSSRPYSMIGFNTDIPTVEAFRTWLQTANCQVMYQLAEPVVYHLTPQAVTTLAGQNNVWADCGDVTVEHGAYLAALQAEIERLQEGGN